MPQPLSALISQSVDIVACYFAVSCDVPRYGMLFAATAMAARGGPKIMYDK